MMRTLQVKFCHHLQNLKMRKTELDRSDMVDVTSCSILENPGLSVWPYKLAIMDTGLVPP